MVALVIDLARLPRPVTQRLLGSAARRRAVRYESSTHRDWGSRSVDQPGSPQNVGGRRHLRIRVGGCASVPGGSATRREAYRRGAIRASRCAVLPWRNSRLHLHKAGMRGHAGRCARPFAPTAQQSVGSVALRVIATQPASGSVYRLDQLIASMARKTLWLSDAYFVGLTPYVQALVAAAGDGVDVRLLVPGSSDIPAVAGVVTLGLSAAVEGGHPCIRVGTVPMLHAKTAVGRRPVGANRIVQSQHCELARQLRGRRGSRGRWLCRLACLPI